MGNRSFIIILLAFLGCSQLSHAQTEIDYRLNPDLWYNSVDGLRVGLNLKTAIVREIFEFDHRIDAGIWYGTKQPDDPISYYASYTKIIYPFTELDEEFNLNLTSLARTGLRRHEISLNKRFVESFDVENTVDISVGYRQEQLFNSDYLLYRNSFQNEQKDLIRLGFRMNRDVDADWFYASLQIESNLNDDSGSFTGIQFETFKHFQFQSFKLKARLFGGFVPDDAPNEHFFFLANASASDWQDRSFVRGRGTVPPSLYSNGNVQFSGGANLRGYSEHDFAGLERGGFFSYDQIAAFNAELEFPNPISDKLNQSNMLGSVLQVSSYLFTDIGAVGAYNPQTSIVFQLPQLAEQTFIQEEVLMDAGIGILLDLNIPDYLGRRRGFILRYEVPFWLSSSEEGDNSFKFRHLIAFGGVISL